MSLHLRASFRLMLGGVHQTSYPSSYNTSISYTTSFSTTTTFNTSANTTTAYNTTTSFTTTWSTPGPLVNTTRSTVRFTAISSSSVVQTHFLTAVTTNPPVNTSVVTSQLTLTSNLTPTTFPTSAPTQTSNVTTGSQLTSVQTFRETTWS